MPTKKKNKSLSGEDKKLIEGIKNALGVQIEEYNNYDLKIVKVIKEYFD